MPASRTLVAISAVVIALLGCGSGKDQAAPVDALSLGLPGLPAPSSPANWTLGGVPCTLIPVPVARDADGNPIGEFAYAILQDPKDFSLIRLDPLVEASAAMCHFGGPTAVNDDRPGLTELVVLNWFGNGVGVGAVLPARSAVAAGMPDPDHVFADGAAAPGDSGSGVISSDGRAVGVLVTVGVHTASVGSGGLDAGMIGMTRLTPQVERAQQLLGVDLALQTAPTQ